MDTDISAAPVAQNTDPIEQDVATDAITKSDAAQVTSQDAPNTINDDSFMENNSLDTTIAQPDVNPAGPTPVDDVVDGIQPIAGFIPKDASINSHPTPPPDQPLPTGEADADTTMTNGHDDVEPAVQGESTSVPVPDSIPLPAQAEPSLVRPREDDMDEDEERAAKRSRVELEAPVESAIASSEAVEPAFAAAGSPVPIEAASAGGVDLHAEPATRSVEASAVQPVPEAESQASEQAVGPVQLTTAPEQTPASTEAAAPQPPPQTTPLPATQPSESVAQPSIEAGSPAAPAASSTESKHSTAPMTESQKRFLIEKMKNLKKTKHSLLFLKPVDPLALNIPQYPDIIKNPMDLGTMDHKLKSDQYGSVQDFVDDFYLIISNTRTFNGDAHVVTQAGMSMKAYFDKMMETVPGPNQALPKSSNSKRSSPAVRAPQRQPRQPAPAAPPAMPAAQSETFALQSDGVPQVRRESNGRPARAIKPPANRDIPYAKPKRKQHQLELRFCEHVLDELRSTKHATLNSVFQLPVDPVALNIPHYHQVIKKPMDLSSMSQKLKQGQYGKASEFKADFELIIANCLQFNPHGNPVRDMGVAFGRVFQGLWDGKARWEKAHKPDSQRSTSASDEDDSDDDDDDDDPPEDDKEQTIQALQKQLVDMQNLLAGIAPGAGKDKRSHKKRDRTKDSKRKSGGMSAPKRSALPAPKAPSKKAKEKKVTYEEKQEISEAVSQMNDEQVAELTRIITENCTKYQGQEEMELEIDDLPNNVQIMLLKFTRKLFGRPVGTRAAAPDSPPDDGEMEDDDFEPSERAAGGVGQKRKKHKPMSKREQQEKINQLNSKLDQFRNPGTSGSESPAGGVSKYEQLKAESSGDDESEESEEE